MNDDSSRFLRNIGRLQGHESAALAIAWAPDGRWLASCAVDGSLRIWVTSEEATPTRPRFVRKSSGSSAITALAWSPRGEYLACGSLNGTYDILESGQFGLVPHRATPAFGAIHCLDWGPPPEPRLVIGGADRFVHFRSHRDWQYPSQEGGVGHHFAISRVAWAPNGSTVVTGTTDGIIGIWHPFDAEGDETDAIKRGRRIRSRDNDGDSGERQAFLGMSGSITPGGTLLHQLTDVFADDGIRAHKEPVTALSWSVNGELLVSASTDGSICVWDVRYRKPTRRIVFKDAVIHAEFAFLDRFLVVQTPEKVAFLLTDSLQVLWEYSHPIRFDASKPSDTCVLGVDSLSRLALQDLEDERGIVLWQVDFRALEAKAKASRRPCRTAGLSFIGDGRSGKTSLLKALAGDTFSATPVIHDHDVRRWSLADVSLPGGESEAREVALWDLQSQLDHAFPQQIHADGYSLVLISLSPDPGLRLNSSDNIERWHHALNRWRVAGQRRLARTLVVVTHGDQLIPLPTAQDIAQLASTLGQAEIYVTSAYTGYGVPELRVQILSAIEWSQVPRFESAEVLANLVEFAQSLRKQGRILFTTREFREEFLRAFALVGQPIAEEAHFREGLRILALRGEAFLFDSKDELVVDPSFYRTYASAMILGAQKDVTGMGRLPLTQAISGMGKQMAIALESRLPNQKQHARLLGLVAEEMVESKLAQTVSTDGISYLVFPKSLTRTREGSVVRPEIAARCRIAGPVEDVFSALVVRFLGQQVHYPQQELWINEATFAPASGGSCNMVIELAADKDEANVLLRFEPTTDAVERKKFLDIVQDHLTVQTATLVGEMEVQSAVVPPAVGGQSEVAPVDTSDDVEIFMSWRSDLDALTIANTEAISTMLRERGIRVFGDTAARLGRTDKEYSDRVRRAKVALVLLAKRPTKEHLAEYNLLAAGGARIIPVILPNASRSFSIPKEFKNWKHLDLRGTFLDIEALQQGIQDAWSFGPVISSSAQGHVFMSYFHEDQDRASALADELTQAGHQVWWDRGAERLQPGQHWDSSIRQAIRDSYAVIVCVSDQARSRSWVYQELLTAIDIQRSLANDRIFIIPVRLSDCDVDEFFANTCGATLHLQYFNYFGRSRAIGQLVSALDRARAENVD